MLLTVVFHKMFPAAVAAVEQGGCDRVGTAGLLCAQRTTGYGKQCVHSPTHAVKAEQHEAVLQRGAETKRWHKTPAPKALSVFGAIVEGVR